MQFIFVLFFVGIINQGDSALTESNIKKKTKEKDQNLERMWSELKLEMF